ncbi:hypothetical protein PG989_000017 [Apiospora arundinis]
MSTVTVYYDSRFETGVPCSTYSWPGQGGDLLGHDLGSVGHGSDISLTPPSTSRSVTGSQPRGTLTPEQRELMRQRDLARRDSKASIRARRGMNGSYSSHSPPVSMNDFPQSSAMPVYETPRPSSMNDRHMLYPVPHVLSSGSSPSHEGHVRVVQSRPKPQCWEHGCNGRQFSTFGNLPRHQREKSGQAKAVCPNCGTEFTRTTARNGHLANDKCKQRRNS